jgi:ATP-dependent phosphofructokinase / diphosphate-dependent phosphofructokinase
MIKRIAILTDGGDCPGLNPAIKWVVKTATDPKLSDQRGYNFEVVGIKDGWRGLMKYDSRHPVLPVGHRFDESHFARLLSEDEVRTWDRVGGTRLGTTRTLYHDIKPDRWQQVLDNIETMNLDALVAIGGDETMEIASHLGSRGARIICLPKTIDRDLPETDYSLGFETALDVIVEEIDRLRTTAHSHSRTFIMETMGRFAGHLAMSGGLAGGADIILIPEVPFDVDRIIEILHAKRTKGQRYAIVIVAEGAREKGMEQLTGQPYVPIPGGIAKSLAKRIEIGTGGEVRTVVLSHLQRGGVPCAYDRRMARSFGTAAVQLVEEEKFGQMVVFRDGTFKSIPIPTDLSNFHKVDVANRYDVSEYSPRFSILDNHS